jgi:hypothetical protein
VGLRHASGMPGDPPLVATWVTGNPASAGAFREGDFVPTRVYFNTSGGATDVVLSGHTYTLYVSYDATISVNGYHAYDYLGTYNESRPNGPAILPCSGVEATTGPNACDSGPPFGNPSTAPVPPDHNSSNLHGTPVGAGGHFSAWGAVLAASGPNAPHFADCPHGGSLASTPIVPGTSSAVARCIALTFTVAGPVENTRRGVVIAWGAHIATAADWGAGRTAALQRPGSADFHQRVEQTPEFPFGNKELPLSTIGRPTLATSVTPSEVHPNGTVTETATLTGRNGGYPRGTVDFFFCGPTSGPTNCASGGEPAGHEETVYRETSTVGTASIQFPNDVVEVPDGGLAPGFYCFRAHYNPAPGDPPASVHRSCRQRTQTTPRSASRSS